jgi:transcriptional regulator with XRE-family HTH domain
MAKTKPKTVARRGAPSIGEAMRDRRTRLKLTQAEAADRGQMSLRNWLRIETNGEEGFSAMTAASIDRALDWPSGTANRIRVGGFAPADHAVTIDVTDLDETQMDMLQMFLRALRTER